MTPVVNKILPADESTKLHEDVIYSLKYCDYVGANMEETEEKCLANAGIVLKSQFVEPNRHGVFT